MAPLSGALSTCLFTMMHLGSPHGGPALGLCHMHLQLPVLTLSDSQCYILLHLQGSPSRCCLTLAPVPTLHL